MLAEHVGCGGLPPLCERQLLSVTQLLGNIPVKPDPSRVTLRLFEAGNHSDHLWVEGLPVTFDFCCSLYFSKFSAINYMLLYFYLFTSF